MTNQIKDRRGRILHAALTAFSHYGFARTKMEDIARESGVARTALYKIFRNKEHIFQALAETVHQQALEEAKQAFAELGEFPDRLANAVIARDLHLLAIGHSGPHADEIADLYLSLANDLANEANSELIKLVTQETERAEKAGKFSVPPAFQSARDFARLLQLALEGVKKEVKAPAEFEKLARRLIAAII